MPLQAARLFLTAELRWRCTKLSREFSALLPQHDRNTVEGTAACSTDAARTGNHKSVLRPSFETAASRPPQD